MSSATDLVALVGACLAGLAVALAGRPRLRPGAATTGEGGTGLDGTGRDDVDLLTRYRLLWSAAAAAGGLTLIAPPWGWVVAAVLFAVTWTVIGRAEPRSVRRDRELARHQLPHVVHLLASVLRGGGSVPQAIGQVCRVLPGPATATLRLAEGRLRVGASPAEVWAELAGHPVLGPLGRTLARADASGASVADAVNRLGEDLARAHRAEIEDLARTVGVRAALPLGVCLLPAFLLIGIVPVVVASLAALGW